MLLDILDGTVTKARGSTTPGGTVLDATSDPIADSALFAGLNIPFTLDAALWLLAGLPLMTVTQRMLAVRRSAWQREAS